MKRKYLSGFQIFIFFVFSLLATAAAIAESEWVIVSNTTTVVNVTTELSKLTIENNANLTAPDGYRLTMTVNGIETGQVLKTWEGVDFKFAPGTYQGDIVLTVTKANDVTWAGMGGGSRGAAAGPGGPGGAATADPGGAGSAAAGRGAAAGPGGPGGAGGSGGGLPTVYPFRQALYLDKDGIDASRSVLSAVQGEKPAGFEIKNIEIRSKGTLYKDSNLLGGTGFNAIYVAGGEYNIKNIKIELFGDGRSDFVGLGTAIVSSGKSTRVVMDNVNINNQGVVRSAVIAKEGSNMIVKNSDLRCKNGILPPEYIPIADTSQMRSTIWISGMTGNARTTSILGTDTQATYINSSISFEGWGGLSTDIGNKAKLTVINCKINNTGNSGYGQYNNSNAISRILGSEINAATIGSGSDSGTIFFGDSTREAVEALNKELGLGLTAEELNGIPVKNTIINSGFQGLMWHGNGCAVDITGGTIINSKDTMFIDKSAYTDLKVDGSQGAQLNAGNGIMMQVMDDDEPGRGTDTTNADYYQEPTGPVSKDDSHDIYIAKATDALAKFSNIELKGDFYNSARGGLRKDSRTGVTSSISKNLGLIFNNARITGVISATDALHYYNGKYYPKIERKDAAVFNRVINTPSLAVNNGVIVTLANGSKWTVTGTSYLTRLVIEEGATVTAPSGHKLTMTDDGNPVSKIIAGTYTGSIILKVN
jgi:hypothetical protein